MKVIGSNNKGKRNNGRSHVRATPPEESRQPIAYAAANSGSGTAGVARVSANAHENVPGVSRRPVDRLDESQIRRPGSRAKRRVKIIVTILLVLVLCVAGLAVGLGYYVSTIDTIFPNVMFEGFDLSGLSLGEATQMLINLGYENNADGISATVVFPDNTEFTVSGPEVGLSLDAREAAMLVHNFGRDGSFADNAITYVRARLEPTELYYLGNAAVDDTVVRERATVYTTAFNDTLLDSHMQIDENQITIFKGTGMLPVEASSVFDLALFTLMRAIEENTHLTANYIPQMYVDESIDLAAVHRDIHVEPISSSFVYEVLPEDGTGTPEGTLVIEDTGGVNDRTIVMGGTSSAIGRTFDLAAAEEMLLNAVSGETVIIPIYDVYPPYTQEQIDELVFRDTLGELTTTIGGSWERLQNVRLASDMINETILLPGEVFDFNQTVGIRTRARGFHYAGAFLGGRLVDMPGGGICQVSSTIYATLLLTAIVGEEIEIVERRPHGLTISYLPYGQDAAIAWGLINLRFRNSFEFPIKVETIVDGRNMNVRIIGTKLHDTFIEVEMVPIRTIDFYTREEETDELPYGERVLWTPGQRGQVVETFQRLYSADGELISRTLVTRDTYNRQDRVTRVGTHVPEVPDSPPPDQQPPGDSGGGDNYPGDDWEDDG